MRGGETIPLNYTNLGREEEKTLTGEGKTLWEKCPEKFALAEPTSL